MKIGYFHSFLLVAVAFVACAASPAEKASKKKRDGAPLAHDYSTSQVSTSPHRFFKFRPSSSTATHLPGVSYYVIRGCKDASYEDLNSLENTVNRHIIYDTPHFAIMGSLLYPLYCTHLTLPPCPRVAAPNALASHDILLQYCATCQSAMYCSRLVS
jgi:hypothetical protein